MACSTGWYRQYASVGVGTYSKISLVLSNQVGARLSWTNSEGWHSEVLRSFFLQHTYLFTNCSETGAILIGILWQNKLRLHCNSRCSQATKLLLKYKK